MDQKHSKIPDVQQSMAKTKPVLEEVHSSQIFGLDKNITVLFVTVIVLFIFSYYLFREFKKVKEEIRTLKSKEIDMEEIVEKVNVNSDSVKAIELKMDQLIYALTKNNSQPQHQVQQPQVQQSLEQVQQPRAQVQVQQMRSPPTNQIVESDDDYETESDDGIIRQPISRSSKEIRL